MMASTMDFLKINWIFLFIHMIYRSNNLQIIVFIPIKLYGTMSKWNEKCIIICILWLIHGNIKIIEVTYPTD